MSLEVNVMLFASEDIPGSVAFRELSNDALDRFILKNLVEWY